MRNNVLALLFICFYFFVQSQGKNVHIIELLPNDTEEVADVDFYVNEIIDFRTFKNNVGVAQKGAFNRKVVSKFSKPFDTELLDYLKTVFPKDSSKTPLALRINELMIYEHTSAFKETGKATVNLDVCINKDGNYYSYGDFSAYAEKNSMDVTRKHDDRIRNILKNALLQFDSTTWKQSEPKPIKTIRSDEKSILVSEKPKEGFYRTFNHLFRNEIFQDTSIHFKDNRNRPRKLFIKERVHKKALYFAYSNGDDIFLNSSLYSNERYFVKTTQLESYLIFSDAFTKPEQLAGFTVAFGLVGALVAEAYADIVLDLNTGMYLILSSSKIKDLLKYKNAKSLLKRYRNRKRDANITKEALEFLLTDYRGDADDLIRYLTAK